MPEERILTISERVTHKALPICSLHLDFLRGTASLVVFTGHLYVICSGHNATAINGQARSFIAHPANATGFAHAAVVIFFVLSGYLVGGSVLRDMKRDRFCWYTYALRRLTRLWTVLVPALVLCTIFDAISLQVFPMTHVVSRGEFSRNLHGSPGVIQFVHYLGFMQSIDRLRVPPFGTDTALWSLSNEFWYYVLFPILAVGLIGTRYPRLLRAGLATLAILLFWILGTGITASFPVWLCGVVAYLAPAKIPIRLQLPVTIAMSIQFCCAVLLMRSVEVGGVKADLLIAVSFTGLLYAILHHVGPVSHTLYSRLAHAMSLPSYSLYAIHMPLCVLLAAFCEAKVPHIFRHTELSCVILCVFVLAYAGIFYMLFERNTDRIRRFAEVNVFMGQVTHSFYAALPSGNAQPLQPVQASAAASEGHKADVITLVERVS